MSDRSTELGAALGSGDLAGLRALVEAGADLRYRRTGGYDALIDAVHSEILHQPELLDLLRFLVAAGVDLDGVSRSVWFTAYEEKLAEQSQRGSRSLRGALELVEA